MHRDGKIYEEVQALIAKMKWYDECDRWDSHTEVKMEWANAWAEPLEEEEVEEEGWFCRRTERADWLSDKGEEEEEVPLVWEVSNDNCCNKGIPSI